MSGWLVDRSHLTDLRLLSGLIFPAAAAVVFNGPRAIGVAACVLFGALAGRAVLDRLRGWQTPISHLSIAVQALLLTMLLPAILFDLDSRALHPLARWPLPIAAGLLLAVLTWAMARARTARFSPLLLTAIVISAASPRFNYTDRVLTRPHVAIGDVLSDRVAVRPTSTAEPWLLARPSDDAEVWQIAPATRRLNDFLRGRPPSDRSARTIARLVSDELPPLEDLVIGGHPRRLGSASGIAVIVGGLFLVYRRLVAFRVPALMLFTLFISLILLPVPIVVGQDEVVRRWLAISDPRVGLATGIIFVHYLIFASPAILVTFFLAARPGIRPLGHRAAQTFAVLFGVLCAAGIVFVSVEHGPVLALAAAQLLAPSIDRRVIDRPLI